jgi:limonene-1,2-epoxide hydrolase
MDEVESFYAQINAGDVESAVSRLAEDVRWHRPPDVPITGTVEGVDEVQRMWASFTGSLDSFEIEPTRFESGGGLVLAPVTMRGSGERGSFEFGGAQVFRITEGRIAEVWEFRSLPEARALLES